MWGKLFSSPLLPHVKKERGARAARAPHLAISAICYGLRLAWGGSWPLAVLKGVLLYDRLDSGHWSADHVLMDSPRFGCRSLSSWLAVFMALLLEGAMAEKARFGISPPWGIARAHRSKGMMDPRFSHSRKK